ncbi:hypothetical protein CROQUDRAFT_593852 [Cronartium quercuum f. sp. fusiforme G11]|uniref:RRM domain-containing protein n=1 Tax=Cronartium quercuum f. sp. fusiforme G11 TaxID=708437 RepID=A0A9P6NF96_9BASI|nr:hypothetical protein CROQUDRAFT_593852 [Cronartium quercuum f. sp. fusiforme G11]
MSSSRQVGQQNSPSKPQSHDPTHFQTRLTSDFNGARHYELTHTPTFSGTIGSESHPDPESTTSQLIHHPSQPKTIFTSTTTQSAMSTNTHSAGPLIIDQSSPSSSLISPRAGPSGLPPLSLVPPLPQSTSDTLLTTSASHGSPTVPDPPSPVRNSPPLGIVTEVLLPPVVLDPLLKEKMNYRCTYDPALDSSVVKKSAGPLYRHFKPSGTIISRPAKDPRLRMAYPSPLSGVPKTASQKSSLVAGLSRSSKGRQTFHSQVERLEPYAFDKNSVRSHFVKFGRVAECEIKLDPQTGGSLGICWVRFVNDVVNSDKDSSGKNRTPPVKSSRGLQNGHQCAVEATQKANGARIGIMLTTGPSQSSSMLRRPQKSQSNWGIKCELDGSGSKCAKAVAYALRKLYPPPPSRPTIPNDSVGHSSSVDQASLPLKQHTSTFLAESHSRSIPPAMSGPSRLETQPPPLVGRSPLPTTKAFEGPKLSPVTSSNTNTPAYQDTPSVPFANHSPMYGSSVPLNHDHSNPALAPVADVLSASQGHREQQNHGSKFVPSGSVPTMPSALRHQAALVQPRGRPPQTEPYTRPFASCSHPYVSSSSAPVNSSSPLPPPIKYRPDETPSVSRMPMVLKTSHYTIPGKVNAGPVRGKIAAGFVAAAQNAAIIAAKKAGIRLPSEVESDDAPIATTSSRVHHSAYSGESDLHPRLEASTSMRLSKETPQDLDEEDDSSESEDEDAQAERLKEAEREALIASRKVRSSRVAPISMEKHSQITLQPNLHQPHSMNFNTSTIKPQQPTSDLMKLSILWSHNCIGVNKSIKLEILKRLSINGHPFVTIDRIELGKVDNRARIPQGPLELKQYLVNFEPHQRLADPALRFGRCLSGFHLDLKFKLRR